MPNSSKTVLITGATGFLGGYLVEEFAANGYEVFALGRNERRLSELSAKATPVRSNLADLPDLALEGVDVVVHAAALSTVWGRAKDFIEANVYGTKAVVDFCEKTGAERLVFISSPSIYAGSPRLNIKEDQFDEHNRLNQYIRSKILAEKIVEASGVNAVILRPRGLFGPGDTSIIPRLLDANQKIGVPLLRGGSALMDITCVENVAFATRLAAEAVDAHGAYNITNGEPRPFKALLDQFFAELGEEPRYLRLPYPVAMGAASLLEQIYRLFRLSGEPTLTRYLVHTLADSQTMDITRAETDLGYHPRLSLDQGITRYIASLLPDSDSGSTLE
jgi:nucleoside-diphosphate-sugar epimerase